MFRIEFFTDDRYVTAIMRLLAGKTHDLKVEPVVGVKKLGNGKLAATTEGKIVDLLAAHIARNNIKTMRGRDLGKFLSEIGRAPGSSPYLGKEAVKAHLMKKVGAGLGAYYQVIKAKTTRKSKPKSKPRTKKATSTAATTSA